MAEDQKLTNWAGFLGPPLDTQMIAAKLLLDLLDAGTAFAPDCGNRFTATVSGGFFEARRFDFDEFAEGSNHVWEERLQLGEENLRETGLRHGRDMLTTPGKRSNRAWRIVLPDHAGAGLGSQQRVSREAKLRI